MKWQAEQGRDVYLCGRISVGDVAPPLDPSGPATWRYWFGRDRIAKGTAENYETARRMVENRFGAFLRNAELRPAKRQKVRS